MKGGIPEATNLIVDLRENHGVFCSIVVYPVIPKGEIILRVIPTAAHTLEDVNLHARGVQVGARQARKRLLPRQTGADESRRRISVRKPTCPIKKSPL